MCDYSLQSVKTRKAAVGDKLTTVNFGTGTTGFTSADGAMGLEAVAVCLLPGTELAFDEPVTAGVYSKGPFGHLARFRQIDKEDRHRHHDALEFADGQIMLLTCLVPGQRATVLQLPAVPMDEHDAEEQRRVEYAG
jgi:hypothetical protein